MSTTLCAELRKRSEERVTSAVAKLCRREMVKPKTFEEALKYSAPDLVLPEELMRKFEAMWEKGITEFELSPPYKIHVPREIERIVCSTDLGLIREQLDELEKLKKARDLLNCRP